MNPSNDPIKTDSKTHNNKANNLLEDKHRADAFGELPHEPQSYHKPKCQLLVKESLLGPVTSVAILSIPQDKDDNIESHNGVCVISRGPLVEFISLDTKQPQHKPYRHFAFGRGTEESGSVHGIRHSSLIKGTLQLRNIGHPILWAFFGGRKLSLALSDGVPGSKCKYKDDHLLQIYITSNKEASVSTGIQKEKSSCLTVSDWIWDARLINIARSKGCVEETSLRVRAENEVCVPLDQAKSLRTLLAIGLAHNIVEIWSFHEIDSRERSDEDASACVKENKCTVESTRLRKLICDVRCITYSLSLFGWKEHLSSPFFTSEVVAKDLELAVAVGTVSNKVLIWNVLDEDSGEMLLNDFWETTERQNQNKAQHEKSSLAVQFKAVSHTLSGHEGVIFSCKFGKGGVYLASTSDDRTVRLWQKAPKDDQHGGLGYTGFNSRCETSTQAKTVTENKHSTYRLVWTGYGHIARVWDCDFISLPLLGDVTMQNFNNNENEGGIVTTGEDGTIRVWSIDGGVEVATLEGHGCQSIWKVSSASLQFDGIKGYQKHIIVSGGNDGAAKLWDVEYHLKNNTVANSSPNDCCGNGNMFLIPDDYSSAIEKASNDKTPLTYEDNLSMSEGNASDNNDTEQKKKTKTRKNKTKTNVGQVICGMNFYPKSSGGNLLLLTTRAGMLCTLSLDTGTWQMNSPWADPIPYKDVKSTFDEIDPSNGSCTAMHPRYLIVAVGTTRGQIVLTSLRNATEETSIHSFPKFTISASRFLAIQGLGWLDDQNLLAFHIKGIVVWWTFQHDFRQGWVSNTLQINKPYINHILSMKVKNVPVGVPMSYLHDASKSIIFIGDSRGNIGVFDLIKKVEKGDERNSEDIVELLPVDILTFVHKKEHVNCIIPTSDGRGILSVGNDGRIQECILCNDSDGRPLKLQKAISKPVSNLSGANHVWCVQYGKSESIIASGFHGNKFIVYDLTLGYQLLRVDTGGRQRLYDLSLLFNPVSVNSPTCHKLAICVSKKGGPNKIIVHKNFNLSSKSLESPTEPLRYSIGNPCHGETILDVAFCKTSIRGTLLLLSGSNDCTVKLSIVQNGSIHTIKDLPPHESCIRALCFSYRCGVSSSLMVIGGGKMSLSFYRVDEIAVNKSQRSMSANNFSVQFLSKSKPSFQSSIDHRINAVKALPLLQHESAIGYPHLVLSGDSNGGLHITVVKEEQQRHIPSTSLTQDARPILSIDAVRIGDNQILACVGDTAGNVSIWMLPGFIEDEELVQMKCNFYERIPKEPVHVYKAHQMGTNCLTMVIVDCFKDSVQHIHVLIGSGGDDQAIALFLLDVTINSQSGNESTNISLSKSLILKESSSSALKGINIIEDKSNGYYRIYACGYDQRIALWNLNISKLTNQSPSSVTFLSSTPVDIFDVNCLDCCAIETKDGRPMEMIVAGGEGIEILLLDVSTFRAAYVLNRCNYLLITCGAGFSADSGLSTYESMPTDYSYLCNPLRLIDDREKFNKFWIHCAGKYTRAKPHSGYKVIESWCHGGVLRSLRRGEEMRVNACSDNTQLSPWWIYSSNVDGHFYRCKGFADTICEIHGRADQFRCANGVGYAEGNRRCGELWSEWNSEAAKTCITQKCLTSIIEINEQKNDAKNACQHCSLPIRPNVLMFHDTDSNVLSDINVQRRRYQEWEAKVEEAVENGCHLVILELGAGKSVPAVRDESEEVLSDCRARLSGQCSSGGSVTCIRINPKDAGFEDDNNEAVHPDNISIYDRAEPALTQIDILVQLLGHGET